MSGTNNLANQGSLILLPPPLRGRGNQLREENPKIKGKGWEKRKKGIKRKEKRGRRGDKNGGKGRKNNEKGRKRMKIKENGGKREVIS